MRAPIRLERCRDRADPPAAPRLSIIMPVRNEERALAIQETALAPLCRLGHEVIVVDGGSRDESIQVASRFATRVVMSRPGRAWQMNAGARAASGAILIFLHADTLLPPGDFPLWLLPVDRGPSPVWGFFPVRLDSADPIYRLIETGINLRARLTRIATGDQALWVLREYFEQLGGFAEIPLMEDIEFSRRLRKEAAPTILGARVSVSVRRWILEHPIRLILRMWLLRMAYACGVPPRRLTAFYDRTYPVE